jgi:hypothetical protein
LAIGPKRQIGLNQSRSFDHRRRPETFLTAITTAFFCPSRTTSRLPRGTPATELQKPSAMKMLAAVA